MSVSLNELQVYRLKVGLFVHRFNETSGLFGTERRALAGSEVWLDQITPDGWAVFGLFGEENKGLYVKCPIDIADEQVEVVLIDGQPEVLVCTDST